MGRTPEPLAFVERAANPALTRPSSSGGQSADQAVMPKMPHGEPGPPRNGHAYATAPPSPSDAGPVLRRRITRRRTFGPLYLLSP